MQGVLQMDTRLIGELIAQAEKDKEGKTRIHSLRFTHEVDTYNPYNSTEINGIRHFLSSLARLSNSVRAQYYFDVQEHTRRPTNP